MTNETRGSEAIDGYGAAVVALGKVASQRIARSDTARRAVTAALGWIGAQRLRDALTGDPERIGDRRVLAAAAELEAAADGLDRLPNYGGAKRSAERADAWAAVVSRSVELRRAIEEERLAASRRW